MTSEDIKTQGSKQSETEFRSCVQVEVAGSPNYSVQFYGSKATLNLNKSKWCHRQLETSSIQISTLAFCVQAAVFFASSLATRVRKFTLRRWFLLFLILLPFCLKLVFQIICLSLSVCLSVCLSLLLSMLFLFERFALLLPLLINFIMCLISAYTYCSWFHYL